MDLRKEKIKRNIFLALQIIFLILTFMGAIFVIMKKVDNAGYAVVPMLWSLIFGGFMRESQKKIKDNSKESDNNKSPDNLILRLKKRANSNKSK